jgi:hypothetical protein
VARASVEGPGRRGCGGDTRRRRRGRRSDGDTREVALYSASICLDASQHTFDYRVLQKFD